MVELCWSYDNYSITLENWAKFASMSKPGDALIDPAQLPTI